MALNAFSNIKAGFERMPNLPEKTDSFKSQDGLNIFYRHYPAPNEKARLVIAHGLAEHSGRYGNVIERLFPKDISIWALDHRGHGQSDGPRGHILSFDEYLNDLRTMVEIAKTGISENTKCFLLGHSMGGLIALMFAIQNPNKIDGLVVSSPGLGMKVKVSGFKVVMGKLMSSIWPTLSLGNELDSSKISRDKEVVKKYDHDPLRHSKVSARWFTEFLASMEKAQRLAPAMKLPILMQLAGEDHLVDAQASKTFYEKLTVEDKTLHFYDGLYHEVYNELAPDRKKVLDDLENWIMGRV
jgi:alpha-beta hydrolase superfamily lysophospholipase